MTPGALRAAQNAAASELAAAVERRGFTGDAIKRARFNEFISGFLSVSVFHAADVWLPLAAGSGHHGGPGAAGGNDGTPRLFVFSSDVKVGFWGEGREGVGSRRLPFEVCSSWPLCAGERNESVLGRFPPFSID